jgi:hypothetical protein
MREPCFTPTALQFHPAAPGFECVSAAPLPPELSHPRRAGREHMGIWRRKAA